MSNTTSNQESIPQISGISAFGDSLIVEFELPGLRNAGASMVDLTSQVRRAIYQTLKRQERATKSSQLHRLRNLMIIKKPNRKR